MPDEFKPLPSHLPTVAELLQEFTPSRRQAASMLESLLPPPPHAILRHDKNAHQPQPEEWIRKSNADEKDDPVEKSDRVEEEGTEAQREDEPIDDGNDTPTEEGDNGIEQGTPHPVRTIIVSGTSLI